MRPLFPTFPATVAYACVANDSADYLQLHPEEQKLIPHEANPRYLASFVAGRLAAHEALLKLGLKDEMPILRGDRGMPLWPAGLCGSLTHKQGLAAAIVAHSDQFAAVGLDLEVNQAPRHPRFALSICTAEERRWLAQYEGDQNEMMLSIFSAKESIFKALYPICTRYFGFQSAELQWDESRASFHGVLLESLHSRLPRGFSVEIGLNRRDDLILTHLLVPASNLR